MFLEIATLVEQQGEMVDNIFHSVNRAQGDVEQGKDHLKKAEELAKRNRKMKICLAAVLSVVILIVLIVILNEFGAFSSSPPDYSDYATPTPKVIVRTEIVYVEVTPTGSTPLSTTTELTENIIEVPDSL